MASFALRHKKRHRGERTSLLGAAIVTAILATVMLLAGLTSNVMPVHNASTNRTISIFDYYFSPQFITISQGDSVTWHNSGVVAHTATSNTSEWAEIILNPGQTSPSITLSTPGNFTYICSFHYALFNMWGGITVEPSAIPEFSSSMFAVVSMLVLMLGIMLLGGLRRKN